MARAAQKQGLAIKVLDSGPYLSAIHDAPGFKKDLEPWVRLGI